MCRPGPLMISLAAALTKLQIVAFWVFTNSITQKSRNMGRDVLQRRLRAGIVGGGQGAFIGAVHRIAVELDGQALVVAGAMSADPQKAAASASAWYLDRSYESFEEMARAEASRADGIDFVIIATPNHLHFPVAKA